MNLNIPIISGASAAPRSRTLPYPPALFSIAFGYTVPKGQISLPEGQMWRSHRRLMGPSMSNQYLRLMTPRISKNIGKLIELWDAKFALLQAQGGAAFEATPDIQLFTMV